jgi:hypothetical protein
MLTTDEAIKKLTGKRSWYKNYGLKDSTARVIKKRFLENELSLDSSIKLLETCGYKLVRQMRWEDSNPSARIKSGLMRKLRLERAFWYRSLKKKEISDKELIENVLMYLDIYDIDLLFKIFPKKVIKNIWKEYMIPQGPSWEKLNALYAFLYFDIEDPERYVRDSLRNRQITLE